MKAENLLIAMSKERAACEDYSFPWIFSTNLTECQDQQVERYLGEVAVVVNALVVSRRVSFTNFSQVEKVFVASGKFD